MTVEAHELAAQVLGMKTSEIRKVEPVEGGAVVTTHDGQRHGINDNGDLVPLAGAATPTPAPVLHQSYAAPKLVAGELIPGTVTTANHEGDGQLVDPLEQHAVTGGVSLAEVARVVGAEFGLDPVAVQEVLQAEFGGQVPELVTDDDDAFTDDDDLPDHGAGLGPVGQGAGLGDGQVAEPVPSVVDQDVDEQVSADIPGAVTADDDLPVDEQVPAGNADVVLAWVGDDHDRARRALVLEEAKLTGKRRTLIASLNRLVGVE